jgi:hypothetical protein
MDSINSVGPIQPIGALTPQGRHNAADPNAPGSAAPAAVKSAPAPKQAAGSTTGNQALDQSNQGFSFEFEDTLNGMSVKIIDKRTHAVLRLVPSQGLLAPARSPREAGPGRGSEEQGLNRNAMKAGS